MKSLKITLLVAVVCAIFASLTPQDNQPQDSEKNNKTIVKVTLDKEKIKIKVPNA